MLRLHMFMYVRASIIYQFVIHSMVLSQHLLSSILATMLNPCMCRNLKNLSTNMSADVLRRNARIWITLGYSLSFEAICPVSHRIYQFKRYGRTDVRLKGNVRSSQQFWAGSSVGDVGGQKTIVKRYEGSDSLETAKVRSRQNSCSSKPLTVF